MCKIKENNKFLIYQDNYKLFRDKLCQFLTAGKNQMIAQDSQKMMADLKLLFNVIFAKFLIFLFACYIKFVF